MDEIHHGAQDCRVAVGVDAVPEVEDMSRMSVVVGEYRSGRGERHLGAGQDQDRIEIALNDQIRAETSPRVADRGAPIESDDRRSRGIHRFEEMIAADPETDRGHLRVASAKFAEHAAGMGCDETFVVAPTQGARPGVEQLESTRPGSELGVDEGDRRLAESFEQFMPQHLVGVHQRLGVLIGPARTPLDQIAGDREGRAGEGQQRYARRKRRHDQFDGGCDMGDIAGLEGPEAVEIGTRTKGLLGDGTGTGGHIDPEADRMGRDDDVAEQHGGIDAVALHRLQGDRRGQLGLSDRVEDRSLTAQGAVFGEAPARLTHEPHRRMGAVVAACCSQEGRWRGRRLDGGRSGVVHVDRRCRRYRCR